MKYFIISLMFVFFSNQERTSLNGNYKLEYKNNTFFQNGKIIFSDSVYSTDLSKNLKSNGIVNYGKNLIFLEGGNFYQNIILSFSTKDIEKDTIIFQVHDKKEGVMNYLDVSVNSGKLIKIRN